MEAIIHSFESMATLDGEGLRYAVFFCGCPLRCVYCHNPDTWFDSGNVYNSEKLAKKLIRYKPYFKDGGGITFSGGEPLCQAAFINEISEILKANGISYCLDTSGGVELNDDIKVCLLNADLVILDLKFYTAENYIKYTGGDIKKVISVGDFCTENNIKLWLRTVVVPGINDTKDDILKYKGFAKRFKYHKYELLAFHTMGFSKYEGLNIENPLKGVNDLPPEKLIELQNIIDND